LTACHSTAFPFATSSLYGPLAKIPIVARHDQSNPASGSGYRQAVAIVIVFPASLLDDATVDAALYIEPVC
jgi:hypothetical protein